MKVRRWGECFFAVVVVCDVVLVGGGGPEKSRRSNDGRSTLAAIGLNVGFNVARAQASARKSVRSASKRPHPREPHAASRYQKRDEQRFKMELQ